tara:strand:- start:1170 stop:1862 length:693 start_codon:yes stop_codon:yes gene_type:complete
MQLDYWFPTIVYTEVLEPPPDVYNSMLSHVDRFHSEHSEEYTVTGDTVNYYQIAKSPDFSWLNKEVAKYTLKYLEEYGIDVNKVDLHCSKAWPVVCNPDKRRYTDLVVIQPHQHLNAHISAVFYLQTDTEAGGELTLHASPTHPIRYVPFAPFLKEARLTNMDAAHYTPEKNMLILFPSSLEHEVSEYYGNFKRYSITYDIIITGKEDQEGDNEMCVINPKNWLELIPNG